MPSAREHDIVNIAYRLKRQARMRPETRAIVFPHGRTPAGDVTYTQRTFRQLDAESDRIAWGLQRYGIGRGCRTVLMVRPSLEFFSLTFSLFKVGAVPVLIDPGMGRKRLLECIREVEPQALIGVPEAHVARLLFPAAFRTMDRFVTVGRRWFWGGTTLARIADYLPRRPQEIWNGCDGFPIAQTRSDEMAAILFTTGSTGPAKGVVYEHGMFDAQVDWIQSHYQIEPGEIDLPGFPLFALFSCAMGMTCVIPDMDPTRPAQVNPERIVEAIRNQGCTNSFGSPAIWNRVGRYCVERGISLPSLKRILMAGAPVPGAVIERMRRSMAAGGDVHTPYGATESLPVASICGRDILEETDALTRKGKGVCVGRPLEGIDLKIIRISDDPIEEWDESLVVPDGEIGEIVVSGRVVTREYYNRPDQTHAAVLRDGDGFRRRVGDVGYLDERGRLWFCGRKSHRVLGRDRTWFTVPCEAIFNQHPDVFRSALVGVGPRGEQQPVMIIEAVEGKHPAQPTGDEAFVRELTALGMANPLTRAIRDVLFHPAFPVDIRHNAKINREQLAAWAEHILNPAQ